VCLASWACKTERTVIVSACVDYSSEIMHGLGLLRTFLVVDY
jgi:hypothetical protein